MKRRFVLNNFGRARFPFFGFITVWLLLDRFHAHVLVFWLFWIVTTGSLVMLVIDFLKTREIAVTVDDLIGISEAQNVALQDEKLRRILREPEKEIAE